MGCFAGVVAVILLGRIHISAAVNDTCDLYAAVGQSLNLPFDFKDLTTKHDLQWTHNNTVVYKQISGKVISGTAEDISPTGALSLRNLQFSAAGIYQANVLTSSKPTWSRRLCVMDSVTKPQLTYVCDFKSSAVALNCNVINSQALVFSWMLGKTILQRETRQTLSLTLGQLKGGSVMCAVENKASRSNSDVVFPACKSPTASTPAPVCLPFKMFGAVLAAGGGLVLVLLIVIIILCCRQKRTKAQMRSGNKVELRLASVNKQEFGSVSPDYETMHATEDYTCPSPKPSPRACNKSGSELEGEAKNKPLQASPTDEEQKPSPVPKPRTKLTQTPNAWTNKQTCLLSNNLQCDKNPTVNVTSWLISICDPWQTVMHGCQSCMLLLLSQTVSL